MKKLLLAALLAAPLVASAQAFPNKPIRWVVPYTAGGLTDSVTRMTLEKAAVGQPFVIDNKPGANSLIGAMPTSDTGAKLVTGSNLSLPA